MKRIDTRALVRQTLRVSDPTAARLLYEHSMMLGHKKIALLRYLDAMALSAPLSDRHHAYAKTVAGTFSDRELEKIFNQSMERGKLRRNRSGAELSNS